MIALGRNYRKARIDANKTWAGLGLMTCVTGYQ